MGSDSNKPGAIDELYDAGTTPTEFQTGVRQTADLGQDRYFEELPPAESILFTSRSGEVQSFVTQDLIKFDPAMLVAALRKQIAKVNGGELSVPTIPEELTE